MNGCFVITGTVTYAIKGRDALRKYGYKAELKKAVNPGVGMGCGYGVVTNCNEDTALEIFKTNGIKYLKII